LSLSCCGPQNGSIDQIKAAGYNLDQEYPHTVDTVSHDPAHGLTDYARLQGEAQALRDMLAQSLDEHRLSN